MFDLSLEKIFVLLVVALFVLGPERLPAAAAWVGKALRQVKSFVGDAEQRLRDEVGPDYDQIKQPLAELRKPLQELRTLSDPRGTLWRGFLDASSKTVTMAATAPMSERSHPDIAAEHGPPIDLDAT